MPNGKDYILFYLKMLLESIDHEGELRFSETIPYNEQMLSVITNTNIDIVKAAMKIFIDLHMVEILDDSTIYMAEVLKLTGSETAAAVRKRKSRAKQKALPESNNVTAKCDNVTKCHTEIELEKEKELEKEIELDVEEEKSGADAPDYNDPDDQLQIFFGNILISENQTKELLDIMGLEVFNEYIARLKAFIEDTGANIKSHYQTLLKWYNEDRRVKK
jgi:predicted phage replisome organizer